MGDREYDFDTSVAHPARVYDYWLGGKDNFVPPGSFLAITQPASDVNAAQAAAGQQKYNSQVNTKQTRRTREQTAQFFDGLELVPPGVVQCHRWKPAPDADLSREVSDWAAVAQKIG
ncbi:hypothetical protein BJ973_002342 [Actinoplanes tereljensis]|uniref:Uncharacterized protein n=1 Tax=Paractinoplanes tereljensis TaxID=571912 RepID=A0A919NND6_9ACTN|nr:SAM-dependent methyltransferase [Actinoplanes tereljensis]GIF22015.1 hypothetical protein Ate02nite_47450 [Actinoplanes tereljensis]